MMSNHGFYDADPIQQVAINLFYGWGYNFYKKENQLRADDQLVRSKAAWLLGIAFTSVETAESAYRREFIPPPSRAQPFPDAATIKAVQGIELLARGISALKARIESQASPESDRMSQRFRDEAATLTALVSCDQQLIGQAELLRSMLDGRTGTWILENVTALDAGLKAIQASLQQRESLLLAG